MKYIRTKDGIYERIMVVRQVCDDKEVAVIRPDKVEFEPILKQADTIEELCDAYVDDYIKPYKFKIVHQNNPYLISLIRDKKYDSRGIDVYGAIWTEWGLKYVAKMNDKGELELL